MIVDVDYNTICTLIDWILSNRPNKKEFTILINSTGGEPDIINYFVSFLSTLSKEVKIKGVAFGQCGSAAMALFQCCHERIAVKNCGFFIHHVQVDLGFSCQKTLKQLNVQLRLDSARSTEESLVTLQAKRCGMSRAKWMKLADLGEEKRSRAILPSEALKLGLIDKIVDYYPLF
jgi:ATP-dependent protease ClpP protease subunit